MSGSCALDSLLMLEVERGANITMLPALQTMKAGGKVVLTNQAPGKCVEAS